MTPENHRKEILFFLFTVFISLIFGLFLSNNRVTDPFLYYDIAFMKSVQGEAQIVYPDEGPYHSLKLAPGRSFLLSQYINMMGIDPEALQFFPIGSILISATCFLVGLRFLRSPISACLITLYLTLNLSHATALYSVFAYGLALPLFFGVILLFMNMTESKRTIDILILLLLFVAANLIHYTIASWIILFFVGANIVVAVRSRFSGAQQSIPQANQVIYLTSAFVVIYFTFNQAIYDSFLPLFGPDSIHGAVQNFLTYLSFTNPEIVSPYSFSRPSSIGMTSTYTLLIILIPILIGMLINLWKFFRKPPNERLISKSSPIIGGILFVGLVDSALYSVRGSISTKAFSIIFPLITIYYFQHPRNRWPSVAMALLLLITSITKVGLYYENSYLISKDALSSSANRINSSCEWIQRYGSENKVSILTDLNLYGKFLLNSVDTTREPIFVSFDKQSYEKVIGLSTQAWRSDLDFIAIDMASTEPLIGFVWGRYKPLMAYANQITNNSAINIVYDDGSVLLAKPVE